jgi:glycine cleavage system H protein
VGTTRPHGGILRGEHQVIPEQLRYTAEHEWVERREQENVVRVGITDFAQDALGDVVFVQLPEVGAEVRAGGVVGEVESTKSVSDVYAPVTGRILACNDELSDSPELVNSDPYAAGWMFDIEVDDAGSLSALLDAGAYAKLTE